MGFPSREAKSKASLAPKEKKSRLQRAEKRSIFSPGNAYQRQSHGQQTVWISMPDIFYGGN